MLQNIKPIKWFIFILIGFTLFSCSNDQEQQTNKIITNEFELTYLYVATHLPIKNNLINNFQDYKKTNPDTFRSIAYTWHTLSINECNINQRSQPSQRSSYEQISKSSIESNEITIPISESERQCLANTYFEHWKDINKMLTRNFSIISN